MHRLPTCGLLLTGIVLMLPVTADWIGQLVTTASGLTVDVTFRQPGFYFVGATLLFISLLSIIKEYSGFKQYFYPLGIIAVISGFYLLLFIFSVNIPINDDYYTLLDFANRFFFTSLSTEKWALLTGFYWESRLIVTRLLIITEHAVLGHIDIKLLILFTNLCLLVVLWVLIGTVRPTKNKMKMALVATLFLFNPGYYDAVYWANDAIHYQFSLLFAAVTFLFFLNEHLVIRLLSVLLAALAGLTFGNGLLVFPVVILLLLFNKNYQLALYWLIVAGIFSALYFHNSPHVGLMEWHSFTDYLIYSCLFLGNIFQFHYQPFLPFIVGMMIWAGCFFLMYKRMYKNQLVLTGVLLYCLLSSLIAAQFRLKFGSTEALSNRYGIFSVLACIAILISVFNLYPDRRFVHRVLPMALVFYCATGFFYFPEVPFRKQRLEVFLNDHVRHLPFRPVSPILPSCADSLLTISESRGAFDTKGIWYK
jgi:hypothetical protein